jgi:diaminopimelate epimerase
MLDVNAVESTDWGYYVNTGSPHLVKVTTELNRLNVVEHGRHLRNTWPEQPGGTNVNFMEKDANGLHVRTYERGVEDETLSCGTGVTACALVAYFLGWLPEAQATIQTRGGTLDVSFLPNTHGYSQVRLIGPAEKVFQGTITL